MLLLFRRLLVRHLGVLFARWVSRKQRLNLSEFLIVQVTLGSHFLKIPPESLLDLQIVSINTTQTG
jgi:hypothetical protein